MTWEWVVLFLGIVLCGTLLKLFLKKETESDDLQYSLFSERLLKLENDFARIDKVADETNKLLSRQNLAVGFGRK